MAARRTIKTSANRRFVPVAFLAVIVALLAACAPARGAAATVDGEVISEADISAVVADFDDLVSSAVAQAADAGQPIAADQVSGAVLAPNNARSALLYLVAADALRETAAEGGVAVSDADAAASWDSNATQLGVTDSNPSDATITYLAARLSLQAIGTTDDAAELNEAFTARLADLGVTVSPRYGTWDARGAITGELPEWILAPAQPA